MKQLTTTSRSSSLVHQNSYCISAFVDDARIHATVVFLTLSMFITTFLLTGCGIVPGSQNGSNVATPVPTPTKDAAGYQAIQPQSCQVADWATMQSNKPQGDLISFRPKSSDLAYFAPSDRSSWYIGVLMLAKGPDYQQRIPLAPSILAAGDLTWSPSGDKLAFLAFRPNENLYTVMSVRWDGSGLTDLFPADLARTDKRTSQKAILGWKDEGTLQVMSSCGEECRQSFDVSVNTQPGPVLTPTPIANYRDLFADLEIHRKAPDYKPEEYPRGMRSPNWSPNDALIAYLDKRGFLWMLTVTSKTIYPLDIGLRDVYETRWTADSRTLGIRAEDRIFVFEIPCRQSPKK